MIRKLIIAMVALLGIASVATAANDASVAVAAEDAAADASISRQAARCPYFLLFNERAELVEVLDNPYQRARRGAGPQVAEFLAGKGVRVVIASAFGPKLIAALKRKNMVVRQATGPAADAVRRMQQPQ